MKLNRLILAFMILGLSFMGLKANSQNQNTGAEDSLMISKLVNQQINDAVTKQNQPEKTISSPVKKEVSKPLPVIENKASVFDTVSSVNIKLLIFATISMMVLTFVFLRRKMLSVATKKISGYKDTINLLRSERLRVRTGSRMKSVRDDLINSSKTDVRLEQNIIKKARELNVSREEILLASKLNDFKLVKKKLV
jgi:hypothetical protein